MRLEGAVQCVQRDGPTHRRVHTGPREGTVTDPRQPDHDPHGDLGAMDPARQAPFPGTEPTIMPENEPDLPRAVGLSDSGQRGPLWDEPAFARDVERQGPLWGTPSPEHAPERAPTVEASSPPPAEPAAAGEAPAAATEPSGFLPALASELSETSPQTETAPTPSPAATAGATSADAEQPPAARAAEPSPPAEGAAALGGAPLGISSEPAAAGSDHPASTGATEATGTSYTPEVVGELKDPSTAFLLELIPGLFGFLGIGYLYIGRTNDGVIRLAAFLVYNLLAWTAILVLSLVVVGLCLIPVQIAIQVGVPIWSALQLRKEMDAARQLGSAPPRF